MVRNTLLVALPVVLALMNARPVLAQGVVTLQVEVLVESDPVAGASVTVNGATQVTDAAGRVTATVAPGPVSISVERAGFRTAARTLTAIAGTPQAIAIELERLAVDDEVIVSATRTDKRLDDQPMRVEVLDREEIEEKMLMTPGDIVMMLNEMGGMRMQATSPSLGAASVRTQGMRGRYTRVLSDGLPLFGDVGGIGLLQIPPMDLGRVEVIKGAASSLYGAGAMGGVVNLISRLPGDEAERELLVNQSTRGATDVVGWLSTPAREGWAMTLVGGGHFQRRADVNADAWADLPRYSRVVIRPRLFWDRRDGRTFFATAGFTGETREGGGMAPGVVHREALGTTRIDAGAVGQVLLRERFVLVARAAFTGQRHRHEFGQVGERDRHDTLFAELTLRGAAGRHTVVGGVAVERDAYRPRQLPRFAYTFLVPGLFIQDDFEVSRFLSLSASGRIDHHSEYGAFVSPRASALVRAGAWTSRMSVGTGFFGSSPLVEETEAAGLTPLTIPRPLEAERGRTMTVDLGRTDGPISYTATWFRSRVRHALHADRSNGLVLTNLDEPVINTGVELLGTFRRSPFAVTASYAWVRARERVENVEQDVSLTPRHSAGLVAMWEAEDIGRVGLEIYYTGRQRLDESPFATVSRAYTIVGLLAERRLGRYRLFINGENLTDVRQTRWSPLVRPDRAPDGRWTVDAWAPLEGRTINGGARLLF